MLKQTAAALDTVRRPPTGLTILIYHRVGRRSTMEVDLPVEAFSAQMEYLSERGTLVGLSDGLTRLASRDSRREPMVAVTFDDGTADFAELALPVLVEHRVPVTLYVATEFVEQGLPFPEDGTAISWPALRDCVSTGFVDVGSHTHTHALLDRLDSDLIAGELDRSIGLIADRVGRTPAHFAYPKAVAGSPEADAAVRARFQSAALAGTRVNAYGVTDPHRLARSPIQLSDGMRWFERKVAGGMGFEDSVRQLVNRRRYAGATT
jgi:peptidoglycan/xylan/chitin deacetylase (PgdA/CDA1 family)